MPSPPLPDADRVAAELASSLASWLRVGTEPPPQLFLRGEAGSGKSQILAAVAEKLGPDQAILIAPPSLDFDAPLHAALQGAAALRGAGVDGVLDPAFALSSPASAKTKALLRAVRSRRNVVLVDLPRFEGSPAAAHRPEVKIPGEQLGELLREIQAAVPGRPAMVAVGDAAPVGVGEIVVSSASVAEVLAPSAWGALAWGAERLAVRLRDDARTVSPLGLRLAIALVALGRDEGRVARECKLGMGVLRAAFRAELRSRPPLRKALALLALARVPVPGGVVDELVTQAGAKGHRHIVDTILLDTGAGRLLHPSIRELAQGSAEDGTVDPAERTDVHRRLAALFEPKEQLQSRGAAISHLEFVFHSARSGDIEAVAKHALDASEFIELGRTLSLQRRFDEATAAFDRAHQLDGSNYALQYRAFNRERARGADGQVECDYRASRDRDPENPWWNRRYVVCLLGRGKLDEARTAFAEGLRTVQGEPRWLASNFQAGIARAFLDRSHLDDAEQVLETVPEEAWTEELEGLRNDLWHRREARRLQGSVFPTSVPFDRRWDGPHLATSPEREVSLAWFPGRIAALDAEGVTLDFCEVPKSGEDPVLLRKTLDRRTFLGLAAALDSDLREGAFLEWLELPGGVARVKFYPSRRYGLQLVPNHLRRFDVSDSA